VAIVSIAHLNDAERMFVVTLLLNQVVSWMRAQSGTSSLRALLYMDEVAGYMPPVSNPASKQALLRLMKQARAFGLGVVLSTQNPVDLDYKGLSNAGTWFLGRLQTERDKARLLDGLEGALAGHGPSFDRAATERMLSSLPKRTFYLHDVHEDAPVVFQTRWAMSYLRGPLTKDQIQRLTPREDVPAETRPSLATAGAPTTDAITVAAGARGTRAATASAPAPSAAVPPVLAPNIEQFFAPAAPAANLAYEPMLYARASVRFSDTKRRVDVTRTVSRRVPFGTGAVAVDWEAGEDVSLDPAQLDRAPAGPATFGALPPAAAKAGSYDSWAKDFARALQQSEVLTLVVDEHTGLSSTRDEREADFRARVQLRARELRDAAKDKLRQKYAPKLAALDERIRRADEAIGREQDQKSQQQLQTGVSIVGTVLGTLFGRKTLSMGNLGRATTSARGMGRTMKESEDVKRAEERLEQERQKKAELERDLETDIAALEAAAPDPARAFETLEIRPKKTHVTPERVVLLWWPNG
jgi:hypothetical protein